MRLSKREMRNKILMLKNIPLKILEEGRFINLWKKQTTEQNAKYQIHLQVIIFVSGVIKNFPYFLVFRLFLQF